MTHNKKNLPLVTYAKGWKCGDLLRVNYIGLTEITGYSPIANM